MKLVTLFLVPSLFFIEAGAQGIHEGYDPRPALEELDLSIVMHDLASSDFEEREAAMARLLEGSRDRLPQVARALFKQLKTSDDPEVLARSKGTFKHLFEFHVLGKGDSNLGVLWHWHMQLAHQGELRARPLVRKIEPESAAAQAGLKEGDIVCYVNGKELHRTKGVVALREILRKAERGEEITLTVRNVRLICRRITTNPNANREVVLKVSRASDTLRAAQPGEYKKWFAAMKDEYDLD